MPAEKIVGNFLSFSGPEGTVIDGVTVGSGASGKPDTNPTTNWTSLGDVGKDGLKMNLASNDIELKVPQTAGLYASKVFEGSLKATLTFALNQLSPISLGLIFGAGVITSGVAFTPFTKKRIRGWWKVEQRDQAGAVLNAFDVYGSGSIAEAQFFDGVTQPALVVEVEPSTLNTASATIA